MADGSFRALMDSFGVETTAVMPEFVPGASYFRTMDSLVYLNEDCSYRAQRVDDRLTLLLHPQEERVVGIQLHSFSTLIRTGA
jgi:hypothetical protein